MTQKIRFHLDENVSNAIAEGLHRRGIDVTTTSETGLIGADVITLHLLGGKRLEPLIWTPIHLYSATPM